MVHCDLLASFTGLQLRRSRLAVLHDQDQRKITYTAAVLVRPIQGDNSDHYHGLHDPVTFKGKGDGGAPEQTGTIPRAYWEKQP
jgi:hypothetical protein